MGKSLTHKIIEQHLVSGTLEPGEEIALRIDQTLTQDVTGTMAYLQFEAIGVPRVRTKRSVSYVDHNMLQTGFESADDHRYLQSVAAKYGVYFSRPGNGICHQVQLERFGVPGETLLGSDSHTPTCGGIGMLAMGAGGLDVAAAMAGYPFYLSMPRVTLVKLTGTLPAWVSAKDVILELLRRLTVKGGVGRVMEYGGDGAASLSVPERATIANFGAELGATCSIFASDERTREFLRAQGRERDFTPWAAEAEAEYDDVVEIDLSTLEPLVAQPHSPDNVVPVAELKGLKLDQVSIGSCTNSSLEDMLKVAALLEGKHIAPGVSLTISPGSRQVLEMMAGNGSLAKLIAAGARLLEASCGPCIGMGQAPPSGGVTLRSFNRNFAGRTGTRDAKAYIASPEVCAASALAGEVVDPRDLGEPVSVQVPEQFEIDDSMILPPAEDPDSVEIQRGPNIAPLPLRTELDDTLRGTVLLAAGDNITTDDIMPAGAANSSPALEYPRDLALRLLPPRPRLRHPRAAPGRRLHRRRDELRSRLEPRARRPRPHVPWRARGLRPLFRPHPPRQPGELRHSPVEAPGERGRAGRRRVGTDGCPRPHHRAQAAGSAEHHPGGDVHGELRPHGPAGTDCSSRRATELYQERSRVTKRRRGERRRGGRPTLAG